MVARQYWKVPTWHLTGVVVGEHLVHAGQSEQQPPAETEGVEPDVAPLRCAQKIRDTAEGEEFSWSGYRVTLYKDACERYWHALIGDKPKVYVVCREDSVDNGSPVEPIVVTVDYDEATAFAETDQLVLSTEIPGELYRYMEAFVLQHYKPKPFEKRKRRKWVDGDSGKRV